MRGRKPHLRHQRLFHAEPKALVVLAAEGRGHVSQRAGPGLNQAKEMNPRRKTRLAQKESRKT